MIYSNGLKFLDKKSSNTNTSATCATKFPGDAVKSEFMSKQKLAEELHRPIIIKFKKEKVRSSFINIIWSADFADIQLISKFNKSIRFLLCFTVIFSKYARAVTNDSNCKAKKIWMDKGNE